MEAQSRVTIPTSRPRNQRATGKEVRSSKARADSRSSGRRRFSITLSEKASGSFEWLKKTTDADTDSEVIRNALRLHHVLLQGAIDGDTFFVRPAGKSGGEMVKVELFASK